ncbi:hypothetical protein MMC09_006138 [Bachmanniomyces sp. S44760]|nr:hypothetical protein [Bachmanniomyces sp. S44760]
MFTDVLFLDYLMSDKEQFTQKKLTREKLNDLKFKAEILEFDEATNYKYTPKKIRRLVAGAMNKTQKDNSTTFNVEGQEERDNRDKMIMKQEEAENEFIQTLVREHRTEETETVKDSNNNVNPFLELVKEVLVKAKIRDTSKSAVTKPRVMQTGEKSSTLILKRAKPEIMKV